MRRLMVSAFVFALLATLPACTRSSGPLTQASQTEHYKVQLALDETGLGERTATIEVNDFVGQPAMIDQVALFLTMREMGMASPEIVAQSIAPGRYQAKGEFFTMLGNWQVSVRMRARDVEEIAEFKIKATP